MYGFNKITEVHRSSQSNLLGNGPESIYVLKYDSCLHKTSRSEYPLHSMIVTCGEELLQTDYHMVKGIIQTEVNTVDFRLTLKSTFCFLSALCFELLWASCFDCW